MSHQKEEKKTNFNRILIWAALGVTVVWLVFAVLIFFIGKDWPTRGQFGDVFGVLNCLFSGLAFAGVIISILMQKEELNLQRQELKETREELKKQAIAQEKQEEALREQARIMAMTALINGHKL